MDYEELSLYDSDVVALVERAVGDVTTKFPEWIPYEGSLEVVLLEAFATITAETVYAANRVPITVMEELLKLYGLPRDAGDFPVGLAEFTLSDNDQERTVPLGTRILVSNSDGESMVFVTNGDLFLAPGIMTGVVEVVGDDYSAVFNGPQPLVVEMLDSVSYVEGVSFIGYVGNGRDPEDLDTYLDRGAARLSRLTTTLVRADQFEAAAMEDPAVGRAIAIDLYDPGQVPPTGRAGHITVAVLSPEGIALSPEQKTAIQTDLNSQAIAILDVHVVDVTITVVNIEVDVVAQDGWLDDDVRSSVVDTLTKYLDPSTWSFGGVIYVNELISVVDQAPGVERVIAVNAPASDVTLAGVGPVANLGTTTVLVNGA